MQKVFGKHQTENDADKVEKLLIFEKPAPQQGKTKPSQDAEHNLRKDVPVKRTPRPTAMTATKKVFSSRQL